MKKTRTQLKIEDLRLDDLSVLEDGCQITIKNDSGHGNMTNYELFDGIYLTYNDIDLDYYYFDYEDLLEAKLIEICHCKDGSWEAELNNGQIICIEGGDLCLSTAHSSFGVSKLPTSHFYGVSLFIDIDRAKNNRFLKAYDINLEKIVQIVTEEPIRVYKSNERLNHIFYEFYYAKTHFSKAYLKIKTLELLLFVSTIDWSKEDEKKLYINYSNVSVVKDIHAQMVNNLDKRYTIKGLSETYGIAPTNLKRWFKDIYGESIYAYIKKIKLEHAKVLLKERRLSVAQIALEIGYENPSKFSTAFKNAYGKSPSKYYV